MTKQDDRSGPAGASHRDAAPVPILSTDVFDTLLLRRAVSERRRTAILAQRLAARLPTACPRRWQQIYTARMAATKIAHRMLNAVTDTGDVVLGRLIRLQLGMLALPSDTFDLFLHTELEVESDHLFANKQLAATLRAHRVSGGRVIAISDTPYSAQFVTELIAQVAGDGIVDKIYTSSDWQATKRKGELFKKVIAAEGVAPHCIRHVGDDAHADDRMAAHAGVATVYQPRSRWHVIRRRASGAIMEAEWRLSSAAASKSKNPSAEPALTSSFDFGVHVMGPILFEGCIGLWSHLSSLSNPDSVRALFCARGGLRMRLAFERVLQRCALPLDVQYRDFMTSRLVAAKASLLCETDATLSEIGRVYSGKSMNEFIAGFGGTPLDEPTFADQGIDETAIRAFLKNPASRPFRELLEHHTTLYRTYIDQCTEGAQNLILVDTGLYGSTLRLLQAAYPQYRWSSLLLARSNYTTLPEEHFRSTVGIWVQRNGYSPFDVRSSILRYWQLIEALFEPDLPTVSSFSSDGGAIRSNLDARRIDDVLRRETTPLFDGAMAYLDALAPADVIDHHATGQRAWLRLRQALRFPTSEDLAFLRVPKRSIDFGVQGHMEATPVQRGGSLAMTLGQIRGASWKEGAAARAFPHLRPLTNAGLEAVQIIRYLRALAKRPGLSRKSTENPAS